MGWFKLARRTFSPYKSDMKSIEIADDVIGIHIDRKITQVDIQAIRAEVEEKLQRHATLGVYVELESLHGISLEALVDDVKLGLAHFRSFSRKAVVSDKPWLEKVVPIFDRLYPSIELRSFAPSERQKAKEWVQQTAPGGGGAS